MLCHIFLTLCLVMMTSCWRIDVSEKNVAIQLSPNVTLECRNDGGNDNNNTRLANINRLRILKRNHNNEWDFVAKVTQHSHHVETSLQNVVVTGQANHHSNSFIKLLFPLATHETIGQFLCEMDGYDPKDEWEQFKTKPVVIQERGVTYQDVLTVIYQFKEQNKAKHADDQVDLGCLQKSINLLEIKENSTSKLLKKLTDTGQVLESKISNEIDNITNTIQRLHDDVLRLSDKQTHIINSVKFMAQRYPSNVWPTGNYSLLQPIDGCPYSPTFDWQISSVRFTTKPGLQNNDKLSLSSHLPPNTLQHDNNTDHHYVYLTMCSKNVTTEGPDWPRGSYCIHWNNNCPRGLAPGDMYLGRYKDGSYKDIIVNYPSIAVFANIERTDMPFCCRNDGSASQPIELPTIDPFYLYRFGGECQEVKNMDVSNEWMMVDTKKKHDEYVNDHPDGQIKPVRIEMCYYKPRI